MTGAELLPLIMTEIKEIAAEMSALRRDMAALTALSRRLDETTTLMLAEMRALVQRETERTEETTPTRH